MRTCLRCDIRAITLGEGGQVLVRVPTATQPTPLPLRAKVLATEEKESDLMASASANPDGQPPAGDDGASLSGGSDPECARGSSSTGMA
jgi:hypothetical protein